MTTALNPNDAAPGVVLSNGNLTAGATTDGSTAVRSTQGQSSGKFYFEVAFSWGGAGSVTGCGVYAMTASLIGSPLASALGSATVYANGGIWVNGTSTGVAISNLTAYPSGGVYIATRCVAVDLTDSTIWFRTNNELWNASSTANPATNTGGISISALFPTNVAFAGLAFQNASSSPTTETANFGATAFAYSVPGGFSAGPSGIYTFAGAGMAGGAANAAAISPATAAGLANGQASAVAMTIRARGAALAVGI
jgi:hypothetical protein